ncbi:MAG TPA: hypothetical protein PKD16_18385 [Saprospiraceae bacterium]|jgi:hypothetical protein|nr:hypothetical protein [Saprospiraceae bacterium]HMT72144.1 hypothetical protein [Saprospiraceae bacterium]
MNTNTIRNRLDKHFTIEGLIQICEKHEITIKKGTTKNDIIDEMFRVIPEKKLSRIVSFPVRTKITILSVLGVIGLLAGIFVDVPDVLNTVFGKKNEQQKTQQYSRSPKLDIDKTYFRVFVDSLSDKCKYANEYIYLDSMSKRDLEFHEFKKIGKSIDKSRNGVKVNIINLGETIATDIKYYWKFDFEEFEKAYSKYDTLLKIGVKKCCITIEEDKCEYSEMFHNQFYNMEQTKYLQSISSIEKKAEIRLPEYFIKLIYIYYNYVEEQGVKKDKNGKFYYPEIILEIKYRDLNDLELSQEFAVRLNPIGWTRSKDKSQMIRTFEIERKTMQNKG